MKKLYIYENELLGDDGTDFKAALVDVLEGEDDEDLLAQANDLYGINDYTADFLPPTESC